MDQVSGGYKRRVLMTLLALSFTLAALINADAIGIARSLYASERINSSISAYPTPTPSAGEITAPLTPPARSGYSVPSFPLLWTPTTILSDPQGFPVNLSQWVAKVIGLLLTALAVTLGASFWFDFLGKFVNVRSAFRPREHLQLADEAESKSRPAA
jgi:hypothetical protein